MELYDKISIATKLLDEIYRECPSAKVILAGDLNLKANEKMKIERCKRMLLAIKGLVVTTRDDLKDIPLVAIGQVGGAFKRLVLATVHIGRPDRQIFMNCEGVLGPLLGGPPGVGEKFRVGLQLEHMLNESKLPTAVQFQGLVIVKSNWSSYT